MIKAEHLEEYDRIIAEREILTKLNKERKIREFWFHVWATITGCALAFILSTAMGLME